MTIFSFLKKKPKIIVICGPTATGKTSLSIELAKKYHGEIVSADSRQVYSGLDIGSAKVTQEEMQGVPHYMINVATLDQTYSVQEYVTIAKIHIGEIIARGKTPIVCGGSGQYIDALIFNQTFPEVPANPRLRAELEQQSTEVLFKELAEKDSRRALSIDKYNKVRLVRALEVINELGAVPVQKITSLYSPLFIGLDIPKEILNERISQRIIERLEHQGMLEEAKNLHKNGLSYERMEELGLEYRYMARHLQNKISYEEMLEQLTTATRQFAKRQRTWFKRNKKISWFNPIKDSQEIMELIGRFLGK